MAEGFIGEYQVLEELGAGGMGTVYRGLDKRTDQVVAIKQLKPALVNKELIERFKREGEALRELNHPNIVKMLDAVEEDGSYYLIMEYVPAGDLASVIKQDHLSVEQILKLSIDLADALTRAHKLNIIHRDLKPANVLIAGDGTLRLTDFGVAHVGSKARVTQTDAIVGTVDYLPPEAFNENVIDERSDIWAFGVILFEMLTGQRPFKGESILQVMHAISTDPVPDLQTLRPDAPIMLVDLIYRMLDKDPSARIASVRHVGAALEDILQKRSTSIQERRFNTPTHDLLNPIRHNLPAQVTDFVGREDELSELARLLGDGQLRLVTILAPGGMGKTRLSLEAAEREIARFKDGVYFIDLVPLRDENSIITAIADAISHQFSGGEDQKGELLNRLSTRSLLLVMDNFEHLLDNASLTTEILQAAPDVKIMVTSRQRLEQPGETLFHLSGMTFPEWETPEDALEYAAVKLFMQAAKRARPDFTLTVENLDYVARVCRLVAGMPLAIVLSAAWLGMLSVEEIAEELQQNIDLLEAQGGDVPARQQSARVVFDYSWQMMTADEQKIFMQLTVFRGGFSREAAQTITGANLKTLMSLVNKSLIRRDATSGRYSIHELLRQYGRERLEKDVELYQTIQREHCHYYLQSVSERTDWLKGGRQIQAADDITADHDNVKRAWIYASEQGWFDLLKQSFEALSIYLRHWKTPQEAKIFWDAVLRACEHMAEPPAVCLYARAIDAQSEDTLHELIPIAEARDDTFLLQHCYLRLRTLAVTQMHDHKLGLQYVKKFLNVVEAVGDPHYTGQAYYDMAYFNTIDGDPDERLMYLNKSYEVFKKHDDLLGIPYPLSAMAGDALLVHGDYEQGYVYQRQIIDILMQFRQNSSLGFALTQLADTSLCLGRIDEARSWVEKARATSEIFDNNQNVTSLQNSLAWLQCMEERYDEAEANAQASFESGQNFAIVSKASMLLCLTAAATGSDALEDRLRKSIKTIPYTNLGTIPLALVYYPFIARYFEQQGDAVYAAEMCSIALHHRQSPVKYFELLPMMKALMADLKASLPPDDFQAAWERGKTMAYAPAVERFTTGAP